MRRGLDLARRCEAHSLTSRAREELRAAGARPRRLELTGVEALTPMERRTVGLVAKGLSNREVAQHLFLTVRTVEMHLTHAYRKLGVSSRRELGRALARLSENLRSVHVAKRGWPALAWLHDPAAATRWAPTSRSPASTAGRGAT